MNPWSLYQHQPELFQAGIVAVATWPVARRATQDAALTRLIGGAALAWAAVGVFDYFLYAFGYQVAGLSIRDTEGIHVVLEWLRVPIALAGALAFRRSLPKEPSGQT